MRNFVGGCKTYTLYCRINDKEEDIEDFPIIVNYSIWGCYGRATMHDPPQYPEVEIERFRIPKTLAKLLGCDENVPAEKVEELIGPQALAELSTTAMHTVAVRVDTPHSGLVLCPHLFQFGKQSQKGEGNKINF